MAQGWPLRNGWFILVYPRNSSVCADVRPKVAESQVCTEVAQGDHTTSEALRIPPGHQLLSGGVPEQNLGFYPNWWQISPCLYSNANCKSSDFFTLVTHPSLKRMFQDNFSISCCFVFCFLWKLGSQTYQKKKTWNQDGTVRQVSDLPAVRAGSHRYGSRDHPWRNRHPTFAPEVLCLFLVDQQLARFNCTYTIYITYIYIYTHIYRYVDRLSKKHICEAVEAVCWKLWTCSGPAATCRGASVGAP